MKRIIQQGIPSLAVVVFVACFLAECDQGGETPTDSIVSVTELSLNKTDITLTVGEDAMLVATVKPSNASDKTVIWQSSNESVAMVSSSGKVLAVAVGTATVTAKSGNVMARCSVTVMEKAVAVTSITLNKSSFTLTEGNTETLVATVKPDNATDKTVTWTSSNTAVATVDAGGKVTAVKNGSATITAKAGNVTTTCSVTVSSKDVNAGGIEGTGEEDMH